MSLTINHFMSSARDRSAYNLSGLTDHIVVQKIFAFGNR